MKRMLQYICTQLHFLNTTLQKTDTENSKQIFPRKGIAWPQSQFTYSCDCERFTNPTTDLPILLLDLSLEYISRSLTYECGNWD